MLAVLQKKLSKGIFKCYIQTLCNKTVPNSKNEKEN